MRILSRPLRRGTALSSPVMAMLAALALLAGNATTVGDVVPAAATIISTAAATPAATAEAEAKEREADAAARRRAILMLILNASGHPFGFFR